jgi:hypothetical protein
MTTPTVTPVGVCDACESGREDLPSRYHGLDCERRKRPNMPRRSRVEQKEYPRKRCLNCPRFFSQTRPDRKFCGERCRKQFHENNGTAYGALKQKLEKLIEQRALEYARKFARECALSAVCEFFTTPAALAGERYARANEVMEATVERVIGAEGMEIIRAAVERRRARSQVDLTAKRRPQLKPLRP